jgi:hypothetical protein
MRLAHPTFDGLSRSTLASVGDDRPTRDGIGQSIARLSRVLATGIID